MGVLIGIGVVLTIAWANDWACRKLGVPDMALGIDR